MMSVGAYFKGAMWKQWCCILLFSCAFVSVAQTWSLAWSDEFNGTEIDGSKWDYDIGTGAAQGLWGWGNGELQYYTDDEDNA